MLKIGKVSGPLTRNPLVLRLHARCPTHVEGVNRGLCGTVAGTLQRPGPWPNPVQQSSPHSTGEKEMDANGQSRTYDLVHIASALCHCTMCPGGKNQSCCLPEPLQRFIAPLCFQMLLVAVVAGSHLLTLLFFLTYVPFRISSHFA